MYYVRTHPVQLCRNISLFPVLCITFPQNAIPGYGMFLPIHSLYMYTSMSPPNSLSNIQSIQCSTPNKCGLPSVSVCSLALFPMQLKGKVSMCPLLWGKNCCVLSCQHVSFHSGHQSPGLQSELRSVLLFKKQNTGCQSFWILPNLSGSFSFLCP